MLSRKDYMKFEFALEDITDECLVGINLDAYSEDAKLRTTGYTNLTKEKKYYFSKNANQYKEQLIDICQNLPIYPSVNEKFCGTIAYGDLLPDNLATKTQLEGCCELADEFFALLEFNHIGVVQEFFKNKYGFQLLLIDPRLKDKIKPNRPAFVQEDIEPNL